MLAEKLAVEPRAVDAFIIGEHGDSEIAVWSAARVAGLPLAKFPGADKLPAPAKMLETIRQAAPEIVKRKGNTSYAIGLCVRRICEAILRDERMALPVSTLLQGEYGIKGVYLGTPCIVGKNVMSLAQALFGASVAKLRCRTFNAMGNAWCESVVVLNFLRLRAYSRFSCISRATRLRPT
jgi:L-lactate dehydrogenase